MIKHELSNRDLLLRNYAYAFTHLYGVLSIDNAVALFNRYHSDAPTSPDECLNAIKQHDPDSVAPFFDAKHIWDLSFGPARKNMPTTIDEIIRARKSFDIVDISRSELLECCSEFAWSTTNAWDIFIDAGKTRHYLKDGATDYIDFCWNYFHYIQNFCLSHTGDSPSDWFMNHLFIADDAEKQKIRRLSLRMYYHTHIWAYYGRTPAQIILKNAENESPEKQKNIHDEVNDILADEDMEFDDAPQILPAAKKVGRNDPCPCGSGLKYKNCCMKKGA